MINKDPNRLDAGPLPVKRDGVVSFELSGVLRKHPRDLRPRSEMFGCHDALDVVRYQDCYIHVRYHPSWESLELLLAN